MQDHNEAVAHFNAIDSPRCTDTKNMPSISKSKGNHNAMKNENMPESQDKT
jgi:hypothetical protein